MLQHLQLKVPPPVVALLAAIVMWWGAPSGAIASSTSDPLRIAGAAALACAAVVCDVAAILAFRRAGTTVNPLRPQSASALVTSGIYRLTRNPMYVGLVLFLFAWATLLGSWTVLVGPLMFGAYMDRFQITPEERALDALFGEAYRAYQAKVRRWL